MKSYALSPLVLLCFICSTLFFISCSKDSDLFLEYVLQDEETNPIENADSDGADSTDETNEEEESESTGPTSKDSGGNLLINGTFENSDEWDLLNGSTVSGGVLTIVANGSIGNIEDNWSALYANVLNEHYYATRRFRITFDARQTSGSGELQIGQRFNSAFDQVITSTWTTYTVDFDGNVNNGGNDINIGGRDKGDTFELDNITMEIIGDTSNPRVPGHPAQVTFYADFEFGTYGYNQWGANGANPTEINQFEVDHGEPRTTDHPDSPLKAGRNGTGTAIWLGEYNNNGTRNEIGRDVSLPFGEHWISFSFYVQDSLPDSRMLMQNRNLAPGGSSTVNSISMRQDNDTGDIYFSLATDVNSVDQTRESLGTWNGAGTNTTSHFSDYTFRAWNDVVIHYKAGFGANYTGPDTSELAETFGYDPRSDGFVEIWVNGNKIVDHVGTTIYRYERRGGEIRFGMTGNIGTYWSDAFSPQGNVYYDNYKIWVGPNGSYEEMDPNR